jgi:geranylgeranyl diphosphate synthase type II
MVHTIEDRIRIVAGTVSVKLKEYIHIKDPDMDRVIEAMDYSLSAGGKRIRPFLVLSVCDMLSGNRKEAMVYACALEMIHTYSLIHDDLPCMDNDDLRRGHPTCHKVYGEATAMLAGDALLTYAVELVASQPDISAEHKVLAIECLTHEAGVMGMIGGQQMDLNGEGHTMSYEKMTKMHSLKTGALIKCACRLGAISASVEDSKKLSDLDQYAEGIGRVFQLVDDILDENSSSSELGKPIHSDVKNKKTTYLTFMPAEMAEQLADVITDKAVEALKDYPNNEILCDLAMYLKKRKK